MFAIAHAFLIANYRNSAMHHQGHWPVFFNKKWNSIYETFASVVSGTPTQSWKCNHFLHHKHVNDYPVDGKTKDPTSVYRFSKTKDPSNFWIYAVKSTASDFLSAIFKTPMSPQLHKIESLRQQNLKEVYAYKLYLISIFLLNWKYGLFLLAVYFLASVFDRAISYGEHWGVLDRRGDTTQDSIGIYSRWYNIVGFGAGYHQEHHRSPGTHWTQYHTITDQLAAERKIINSMHITNNPFWSHFKLLFEK
jgi:fatty acid desaturase